jgi:hypothetical protein
MDFGLIFIFAWILWHLFIVTVRDAKGGTFYGISTANVIGQYANQYNTPHEHILLWEGTQQVQSFTWSGLPYTISSRPISGDHIHMSMSIWINGIARQAEHDRPITQNINYETKENICKYPGNIAYTKVWPHVGVHTHCDGLIHVHPWSAPKAFRQEGRDVQLGLWFDQVGIQYRPNSFEFYNGTRHDNNATHKWRIAEYPCYNQSNYKLYEDHFDKIWLGHAYASYVMWYGYSEIPPPAIKTHIASLKKVGATGFNGRSYPHNC